MKSIKTSYKNLNQIHVLNLVRMHPHITAREISNKTGLQISTVLYTLKGLQEKGLIYESKMGISSAQGGKPPVCWALNANYGFVIGIELLSREIRIVILHFNLEVMFKKRIDVDLIKDPEILAEELKRVVDDSLNEAKIEYQDVLGIGLGMSGSIDFSQGIVKFSFSFDFHRLAFLEILSKHIPCKIILDNDANAGAAAIKWLHDKNQIRENFIYITIQQKFSGMGVGFVVNHEIFRGAHGAAGEIASFLKQRVMKNIIKRTQEKFGDDCNVCTLVQQHSNELPDISKVLQLARQNDKGSIFILHEIAKEISKKIVDLVNLFDPELVMIGGDIADAKEYIQPVIAERIRTGAISESSKNIPVKFSPFNGYTGAMGGAALALQTVFE